MTEHRLKRDTEHEKRMLSEYASDVAAQRALASQPKNRYTLSTTTSTEAVTKLSKKQQKRAVAGAAATAASTAGTNGPEKEPGGVEDDDSLVSAAAAGGVHSGVFRRLPTLWPTAAVMYATKAEDVGREGYVSLVDVPLDRPIPRKVMREILDRHNEERRQNEEAERERRAHEQKIAAQEAEYRAELDAIRQFEQEVQENEQRLRVEQKAAEVARKEVEHKKDLVDRRAEFDQADMRLARVLDDFMQMVRDGYVCILTERGDKYTKPKRRVTALSLYQKCNRVLRMLREGQCRDELFEITRLREQIERLETGVMVLQAECTRFLAFFQTGKPLTDFASFQQRNASRDSGGHVKSDAEIATEGLMRCQPALVLHQQQLASETKRLAAVEYKIKALRDDKIGAFRAAFADMLGSCSVDIDSESGVPCAYHVEKVLSHDRHESGRRKCIDFANLDTLAFDTHDPFRDLEICVVKREMRFDGTPPLGLAPASREWLAVRKQHMAARLTGETKGPAAAVVPAAYCATERVPRTEAEIRAYWVALQKRRTDRYEVTRYRSGVRISTMRTTGGGAIFEGTVEDWASIPESKSHARDSFTVYDRVAKVMVLPVDKSPPQALSKEFELFCSLNGATGGDKS